MAICDPMPICGSEAQMLRLIGLHKWALNLHDNTMHLEVGKPQEAARFTTVSVSRLAEILNKEEFQAWKTHWGSIVADGTAGPDLLPFVKRDGSRIMVESVGTLHRDGENSYITGFYRPAEADFKLQKKNRLLSEFLGSFVKNSPSCILVIDASGRISNTNEALKNFFNIKDLRSLIGRSLDSIEEIYDRKFITVMKAALASPGSVEGKHVLQTRSNEQQTVYWRCFSLSTQDESIKTRVISFNAHAAGPLPKNPRIENLRAAAQPEAYYG